MERFIQPIIRTPLSLRNKDRENKFIVSFKITQMITKKLKKSLDLGLDQMLSKHHHSAQQLLTD
jgi:hypothetical protein